MQQSQRPKSNRREVSKCLTRERVQQKGQLDPCQTPHGNFVVRTTLLSISLLNLGEILGISVGTTPLDLNAATTAADD